ncbi:MAG TPA: c-type cytochrome domain-containing protein, partial [Acidobacteriota bacterium]|nr:c-type cytochrome domain-containing protein [Acidobacteriota bacterium]
VFVGSGVLLALVLSAVLVLWIQDATSSSFFLFFGRLHPVVLHLPIGILLLVAIFELVFSRFASSREAQEQMLLMLILGAFAAVFGALSGLLLSQDGGYEGSLISWHKWSGIFVAASAVLAVLAKVWTLKSDSKQPVMVYRSVLTLNLVLILMAGHYGGQLTHGENYLTEYLPAPLKRWVGLTAADSSGDSVDIMQAKLFEQMIQPIFSTHCIECHGEGKQRGNLRLDNLEAIMKGGESGPVLRASDPNGSEIYRRLILPLDDDERMPPGSRRAVPIVDTEILRWWIEQGADPDMTVAEAGTPPAAVQAYLNRLGVGTSRQESPVLALELPPPDPEAVRMLQERGVMVTPLAQGKNHLSVQANFVGSEFGDEELSLLRPIANHIVTLNLAGTAISDQGLVAALAEMKNLVRLHLERTSIDGEGLKVVSQLPALEYLNLYGTKVDDEVIPHLSSATALRSVYLWGTDVSPGAIETLAVSRPKLQVNAGAFEDLNESLSGDSSAGPDDSINGPTPGS